MEIKRKFSGNECNKVLAALCRRKMIRLEDLEVVKAFLADTLNPTLDDLVFTSLLLPQQLRIALLILLKEVPLEFIDAAQGNFDDLLKVEKKWKSDHS